MRRIALLGLILLLPACQGPGAYVGNPFDGFGGFLGDSFSVTGDPHRPIINSENMRRAAGQATAVEPLLPEPGNIWPGPPRPEPTLSDIEHEQNLDIQQPPAPPPARRGSSTPPPVQPEAPATMSPTAGPGTSSAAPAGIAPAPIPPGSVMQTPQGQAVITNGGGAVQNYITPNGATGTVINNGNGTVTLVGPNGDVQSVPAPR
jgi:hypothetical protein